MIYLAVAASAAFALLAAWLVTAWHTLTRSTASFTGPDEPTGGAR